MTQNESEQKKRECWEEYCKTHPLCNTPVMRLNFDWTFDRAFALGKQDCQLLNNPKQLDADTVIQGWVARDERGFLAVYKRKPERELNPYVNQPRVWSEEVITTLNEDSFLDLTWESDPETVEITIKRKKK